MMLHTLLASALLLCGLSQNTFASTPLQLQQHSTINKLSSELLASKFEHAGMRNTLVSPVSLYYALSVLREGAGGHTAEQMDKRLLSDTSTSLLELAPALRQSLTHQEADPASTKGQFALQQSIWSTNGQTSRKPFVFSEAFVGKAQQHYDAEHYQIDFMQPQAAQQVNQWASDKTNGLIPEIIDSATLQDMTWVIMNAAYFEGGWGTRIIKLSQRDNFTFRSLDGQAEPSQGIRTSNYQNTVLDLPDGSVAFRIPFRGYKYSLVVHAQSSDNPVNAEWLQQQATQLEETIPQVFSAHSPVYSLNIRMPMFSFSDSITMEADSPTTQDMELQDLFLNTVNLRPLADPQKSHPSVRDSKVGLIKQNSRMELDENGVKAAAVTLIGGAIKSTNIQRRPPQRHILVDQPFAFAIVENASQTMLFSGVLTKP